MLVTHPTPDAQAATRLAEDIARSLLTSETATVALVLATRLLSAEAAGQRQYEENVEQIKKQAALEARVKELEASLNETFTAAFENRLHHIYCSASHQDYTGLPGCVCESPATKEKQRVLRARVQSLVAGLSQAKEALKQIAENLAPCCSYECVEIAEAVLRALDLPGEGKEKA